MVTRGEAPKASKTERGARFLRNAHFLGAAALFGVGVLAPPVAAAANALGVFQVAHGGAWEVARRHFKKKRIKKSGG